MSVNNPRPQKCQVAGCRRDAQRFNCLCGEHWYQYYGERMEALHSAWLDRMEAVTVLPMDDDEDTQPVPTFDLGAAAAFDRTIEAYAPDGTVTEFEMTSFTPRIVMPHEWARQRNGRS